jgi:hypothetical protein
MHIFHLEFYRWSRNVKHNKWLSAVDNVIKASCQGSSLPETETFGFLSKTSRRDENFQKMSDTETIQKRSRDRECIPVCKYQNSNDVQSTYMRNWRSVYISDSPSQRCSSAVYEEVQWSSLFQVCINSAKIVLCRWRESMLNSMLCYSQFAQHVGTDRRKMFKLLYLFVLPRCQYCACHGSNQAGKDQSRLIACVSYTYILQGGGSIDSDYSRQYNDYLTPTRFQIKYFHTQTTYNNHNTSDGASIHAGIC